MNGIINVYKPKGISSHGVVSRLRKILNMKRIGHTGTLDPNVTGVLPICIGKATRVSEFLLDENKSYTGELTLGIKTDSQDADGLVLEERNSNVDPILIRREFKNFLGDIEQIPPMHSAVRHKGKRLYELARQGIEVERKPRKATIYSLDIVNIDGNKIIFDVECSKGTYVRTLCNDIGDNLGSLGYMSHLIRTGVGPFDISKSYSLDYIETLYNQGDLSFLLPMDTALRKLERLDIDSIYYDRLLNGMKIRVDQKASDDLFRIYCRDSFIGIGRVIGLEDKNYLKMDKVLV